MSIEENKAIVVRHLKEFLEQGKLELIDSYYAPDGSDPEMWSAEQWRDAVRSTHKNSPGFKVNLLELVAEGEWVMAYIQFDLPNADVKNPLKLLSWRNVNIHRIVNGKIVVERFFGNQTDVLEKEGLIKIEKVSPAAYS